MKTNIGHQNQLRPKEKNNYQIKSKLMIIGAKKCPPGGY